MDKIINRLEFLRRLRIACYLLAVFIFIIIFIINQYITAFHWLYTLILFDDILLLFIIFFLIELKIGYRYDDLYHSDFIPMLFNKISDNIEYIKYPKNDTLNSCFNKIYNYDSKVVPKNVVRYTKKGIIYELYDSIIFNNTYKSSKIVKFKGYILVLPNNIDNENNLLVLYNRKPLFASYKQIKEIKLSNYKFYSENCKIKQELYEKLKEVLEKQMKKGNKYNIYINSNVIIFKSYIKSFYTKPIFTKINNKYVNKKIRQFENIKIFIDDFIKCFENK